MKRQLAWLLAMFVVFTLPASGQRPETVRVNADRVNLRKGPSVDSGVVRALVKGATLTVVSRQGNWVRVQTQGPAAATGWVRSDLLDTVTPASGGGVSGQTSAPPAAMAPPPPPPPAPPPAPLPPPPPSGRRVAPPPPPKAQKAPSGPKDASYHGGLTLFGGITSFKGVFTPDPGTTIDNASGFAAGLGVIIHLGGPIGIELDGAYVQKGFAESGGGATITVHDNYANGSLLLRPAFGSGPVRFFLLGGAEAGYLINCSSTATGISPGPCTIDADQNRTDYGAIVGGGLSFGPLAVQVRYNIGIANLTKTAGETAKNKGLLVLGSIIF